MILILVAVLVAVAFALHTRSRRDLPKRLVAFSTAWLPADRRGWRQALVAELSAVRGHRERWLFAAGVLRLALFPPASRPASARTCATVGALTSAVATAAAARLLPTLAVFVAAFGLLMTACATAFAGRWPRVAPSGTRLAAGAAAIVGVLAVAAAVVGVGIAHPAATRDGTHVFSLVLAASLSMYLIVGLSVTVTGHTTRATRWGGVIGASAAVVASILLAHTSTITGLISPVIAGATLAAAIVVGVVTGDRSSATRAGVLAAVLSAPLHFAITVVALESSHPTTLTNPYDINAYRGSGYPDVASYLLGDALGGEIVSFAVTPLAMYALAAVAATGIDRLRAGAARRGTGPGLATRTGRTAG
jgi:hypothetical protein